MLEGDTQSIPTLFVGVKVHLPPPPPPPPFDLSINHILTVDYVRDLVLGDDALLYMAYVR